MCELGMSSGSGMSGPKETVGCRPTVLRMPVQAMHEDNTETQVSVLVYIPESSFIPEMITHSANTLIPLSDPSYTTCGPNLSGGLGRSTG
jgi:hypothetical protein